MDRIPNSLRVLVLILCAAGPYLFGLSHAFVYDDHGTIVENAFLENPAHVRDVLALRTLADPTVTDGRRPVVLLSYFSDRWLWGLNPVGLHATNILLHVLACWLVFRLALRVSGPSGSLAAWVAALFFAVHPALSEAVQVPAFREDLLCTLFILLGLLWALRPSAWACVISLSSIMLAGLSKESAVVAPVLMGLLFLLLPSPGDGRRRLLLVLASGLISLAWMWLWSWTPQLQALDGPWNGYSLLFPHNLLTAPWIFVRYIGLLLWPWELCADIRLPPVALGSFRFWAGLFGLSAWLAGAWSLRRVPLLAFGMGWFLIAFLPVSNLLPLFNPMAERYLYLMAAGFVLIPAWALTCLRNRRLLALVVAALCATGAWATAHRLRDWKDDATLWAATLKAEPRSARAQVWLGLEAKRREDRPAARAAFLRASELNPREATALLNLAVLEGEGGRYAEAEALLRSALELQPKSVQAHWNLAVALRAQGRDEESFAALQRVLALDPRFKPARQALGLEE